ncbi:hypothetical protein C0991_010476 [Blastosporella zonata]|nr:hypothetical protein C0991_010476 [Blastosporella zonata]
MGSGPSNARPAKISKTGSGQPSTKQTKAPVDISGAHATDKDSVDEGLEGDIAVRVQWSTRALVRLAPHEERVEFREAEGPCQQCTTCRCLNSGVACRNLARDTARDAQRRARVVRKKAKRTAAPATRAARVVDDEAEESPGVPNLGEGDDDEGISGEGISGVPELEEERNDGALVAPEVAEGDGESESARSVWRPADKPATEFERVTRRVGELRELEAGMADYAATCERELAAMRFELLRLQTTLGKTRRLQGALIEARREAEEALWDISAFE